jgi:hypothetical protein
MKRGLLIGRGWREFRKEKLGEEIEMSWNQDGGARK